MKIGTVFPSRFLKAGDLDGREHTLVIKEVKLESVGQTREQRPVVFFKSAAKGLVLNVTNGKRIAKIVGNDDTDSWPGHKVTIYATETEFGGETVDCIRVKPPVSTDNKPVTKAAAAAKSAKKPKVVEPEPDDPLPEPGETADVVEEVFETDEDIIPF